MIINVGVASLMLPYNFIDLVRAAIGLHLPVVFLLDFYIHRVHEHQCVAYKACPVKKMVRKL